jgi:hypothetical protein
MRMMTKYNSSEHAVHKTIVAYLVQDFVFMKMMMSAKQALR